MPVPNTRRASARRWPRVALATAMLTTAAATAIASGKPLASPDEIYGHNTVAYGIMTSPDGHWTCFETTKGGGIIDLRTGKLYNAGVWTEGERWETVNGGIPTGDWAPHAAMMAFWKLRDGKYRLSLWTPDEARGKTRDLITIPNNLTHGRGRWSPDGKIYYFTIDATVPWMRANADDDSPPSVSVNVNVKMTAPYSVEKDRSRIEKEYPDAYAEETRTLILAIDIATGRLGLVAKGNDVFSLGGLYLSPDGKKLIAVQSKAGIPGREMFWTQQGLGDLYLIDVPKFADLPAIDLNKFDDRRAGWSNHSGARLKPILSEIQLNTSEWWYPVNGYHGNNGNDQLAWAPDSKRFAYATTGRASTGDIFVYTLADKSLRNLTEQAQVPAATKTLGYAEKALYKHNSPKFGQWYPPLWLPNGEALLVVAGGELWRVQADGKQEPRIISQNMTLDTQRVFPVPQQGTALVDHEGRVSVIARERISRADSIWKLDPQTGAVTKISEAGVSIDMNSLADVKGETVVFSGAGGEIPRNVYRLPLAAPGPATKITDYQKELADVEFPKTEVLETKGADGGRAFGLLYLPANASATSKVPMVVFVNPGDIQSQLDYRIQHGTYYYTQNIYNLVREGIAVLMPDIPMSQEGVYAEPMKQMADGAVAISEAAIATGLIDRDRLGIMNRNGKGWYSWSAYMVLGTITQTDMFKSAVTISGFSSLLTTHLSTGTWSIRSHSVGQGRMETPLWQAPERYLHNSPMTYLNKVHTPVLLIHGEDDIGLPIQNTADTYRALRYLKKTTLFARYNRLQQGETTDTRRRTLLWFREHLKGAKAGAFVAEPGDAFLGGARDDDKLISETRPQ